MENEATVHVLEGQYYHHCRTGLCTLGCASRNSATAIAFSECLSILTAKVFKLRWSRNASNGDYKR